MRLATRLRAAGALWLLPLCLGLIALYFFKSFMVDFEVKAEEPPYAPRVVSSVLLPFYALSYAVASGAGAWESGRLKNSGVWDLAATRSRMHIMAHSLLPAIMISWMVLLAPVLMALTWQGVLPTPSSTSLLAMAILISVCHAVIGFSIARVVPRIIATPVLAAGTFYAVAGSWSYEPFWARHLSGQFPSDLMLGELPQFTAIAAHILVAASIACALWALLVAPRRQNRHVFVIALAVIISCGGLGVSYSMVNDWGHTPPLSTGHVEMQCSGVQPQVCAPSEADIDLADAQVEIERVFDVLDGKSNARLQRPVKVSDSIVSRRFTSPADKSHWILPITQLQNSGSLTVATVNKAISFPCSSTNEVNSRSARLWAAEAVGAKKEYLRYLRGDVQRFANGNEVLQAVQKRVVESHKGSLDEQTTWLTAEVRRACANSDSPAPGDA